MQTTCISLDSGKHWRMGTATLRLTTPFDGTQGTRPRFAETQPQPVTSDPSFDGSLDPTCRTEAERAGYRPSRFSLRSLTAVTAFHVAALAVLLSTGIVGQARHEKEHLAVFDVAPPPSQRQPPPEPVSEPVSEPVETAPIAAPRPRIELPVAAPRIAVAPSTSTSTAVNLAPPQASGPSAPTIDAPPAPPAPITPPDFNAAQLNNPGPRYPFQSRRNREEGTVLLKVMVTPSGGPSEVRLHESSGFRELDQAAIKAVKHWRFVPAQQAGQAIAAWVIVPISFALG